MILLKSCPRCRGDLADEEWLGHVDLTCIQCGYRRAIAPGERATFSKTAQFKVEAAGATRVAA